MKQILFIIICLFCCNSFAQKLSVESMTALPMDLSASQYEMGARFEGNVVGSAFIKVYVSLHQ